MSLETFCEVLVSENYSLDSWTTSAPFAESHDIFFKPNTVFCKPSFRQELLWLREQVWVLVNQISRTGKDSLCCSSSAKISTDGINPLR
jgi:hypothetical protein